MLIVLGALLSLNRSVIYSASSPSVVCRPLSYSLNFCRACRRLRSVFSANDFSTNRTVDSGINSTVPQSTDDSNFLRAVQFIISGTQVMVEDYGYAEAMDTRFSLSP